jgi:L-asparaginase
VTSIAVFFLGGTISMAGHGQGVVNRLGGDELVSAVPQLGELGVTLDVHDFRKLPSACLHFDDIVELVAAAAQADADGADGVVVVQGTDTIEETSYLIDLLWTSDTPIVMTGAMRNPTLAGPDGPANLLAAVQVAAGSEFRGDGCLVVLNDQVHAARYVRKTHSTSPATFAAPNAGPLGQFVEGVPVRVARLPGRFTVPRPSGPVVARVPVVTITLDDGGELLSGLANRVDGLVVAAFGVGHVPDTLAPVLGDLAARMPVVLASRTGAGPVLRHTYGFTGSETDLAERGLIGAGLLDPYKARVLLRLLLAGGASRDEIAAAFAAASGSAG